MAAVVRTVVSSSLLLLLLLLLSSLLLLLLLLLSSLLLSSLLLLSIGLGLGIQSGVGGLVPTGAKSTESAGGSERRGQKVPSSSTQRVVQKPLTDLHHSSFWLQLSRQHLHQLSEPTSPHAVPQLARHLALVSTA